MRDLEKVKTYKSPESPASILDRPRVMVLEPDPMGERAFRTTSQRTQTSLAGVWDFVTDPDDQGQEREFFTSFPEPEAQLLVPGSWNTEARFYMYHGPAWYSRTFTIDHDTPLHLHFGGIFLLSTVWLDGQEIGSNTSGYTAVDYYLSCVEKGEHRLTVRCNNRMTAETLPKWDTDWFHFGGIPRPVYVESVPRHCIEQFHLRPLREDSGAVRVEVDLRTRNLANVPVESELTLEVDGHDVLNASITAQPGDNTYHYSFPLDSPLLWSSEEPNLYVARCVLDEDDQFERFGVRWLETEGRRIKINDSPFKIRGANRHDDHPDWGPALPERILRRDVEILKRMNANAFRVHYPPSKMVLDLCDEQGIYMFSEIPAWQNTRQLVVPEMIEQMRGQLDRMIDRDMNHPSVISWSLGNEWTHGKNEDTLAVMHANIESLFRHVKERDNGGGRFVGCVTGGAQIHPWSHLYDVILTNWGVYSWYYADSTPVLTDEEKVSAYDKLRRIHDTFPDKPVIITEFGSADSISGYLNWGNEKWSENFQAGHVQEAARYILENEDISGGLVWQFYDVRSHVNQITGARPKGLNNKGVLDRYRNPKLAFFRLQEEYARHIEQ